MTDYRKCNEKEFIDSAAKGAEVKVVSVYNIGFLQVIDGAEMITMKKYISFESKQRTNLDTLSTAQHVGVNVNYGVARPIYFTSSLRRIDLGTLSWSVLVTGCCFLIGMSWTSPISLAFSVVINGFNLKHALGGTYTISPKVSDL